MILTDEEIIDLFPDQDNGDGDIQYGRSIEAAVLAKLNSAEPVAVVDDAGVIVVCSYSYKPGDKLFAHPPAPSAPDRTAELEAALREALKGKGSDPK